MVTRFLVLDNDYSLIPDPNDLDKEVIAIQGYALHENIEDNCPFESISRENAFEISDETEIIKLRSTYFENDTRIRACKWKFNSTIQYGFKIVVEIFDNTTTANFTIKNSTDIFVV
uniref:Uncharacterized protein n=1 Tax=Panagrolaimus davidi TaxID=227884 RepID=A0A914PM49_9BILA